MDAVCIPALYTPRLCLRQFEKADTPVFQVLVNDRRIAGMTLNIPYPYPEGAAEKWFVRAQELINIGSLFVYAITRLADSALMGSISLKIASDGKQAEVGYWLGVDFWGAGYMTEALRRMITFGFEECRLNRIEASYFTHNPASARVMAKAGMIYEGTMRQHIRKWGSYVDLGYYSVLRTEYKAGYTQ